MGAGLSCKVAAGHLPPGVDSETVPAWWLQGKVCYYCASQGQVFPSATLHHRYIDCERRSMAGAAEYTEGAIERAIEMLTRRKEELDGHSPPPLELRRGRGVSRSARSRLAWIPLWWQPSWSGFKAPASACVTR